MMAISALAGLAIIGLSPAFGVNPAIVAAIVITVI